jgi:hypothetical protein
MGDARFGTWRGEDQMISESEGGQAIEGSNQKEDKFSNYKE